MVKIKTTKQTRDEKIKVRKKGNSYEARKTLDLSKIYGFEVKKRISKTALTEDEAIALLRVREQEELLDAAEKVKTKRYSNKLEYDTLENNARIPTRIAAEMISAPYVCIISFIRFLHFPMP